MRLRFRAAVRKTNDTLGFDRRHAFLNLQRAFNEEIWLADDGSFLFAEEIRTDDDVRDPGFVFQREEHKSFRRTGTLTRDYSAGHTHAAAVAAVRQIAVDASKRVELAPPVGRGGVS